MLLKFLRPSKVIAEAIVNPVQGQRLNDLIAVSCETTTRGGKTFVSIFFRSACRDVDVDVVLPQVPGLLLAICATDDNER